MKNLHFLLLMAALFAAIGLATWLAWPTWGLGMLLSHP